MTKTIADIKKAIEDYSGADAKLAHGCRTLLSLSEDEQDYMFDSIATLASKFNNMGAVTALEFILKAGREMVKSEVYDNA